MFQVGIYARISKEDGDNEQSESIDNQIKLIKDYINKKDNLILCDIYIDDGYSGLRFYNRPGFQRMMTDIKEKKINTVITKDMSRFGRESIETSTYLEKVFPELGVRYVSILDNYDSFTGENTEVAPFKILLNDMYSKDISRKVRASFEIKRKNGQFIGSSTPYGYIKSKDNHNNLVIDEYASAVVKKIFALYIEGNGKSAIATILEKEGILPPSIYKKEILKQDYYNPNIKNKKVSWSFQTIHQILTNEIYIGNMVQKKQETISYKVRKKRTVPKEERIVVEGTHEAIINRDTFNTVQQLMENRMRSLTANKVDTNLFAGTLQCKECGCKFTKTYDSRKKEFVGYVCSQYKRHGNLYCTSHLLKRDELETIILHLIKQEARKILQRQDIDKLSEMANATLKNGIKNIKMQISELEDKIKEMKHYKQKTFEHYMDCIISKEDYTEFATTYDKQINLLNHKIKELYSLINEKKDSEKEDTNWVDNFKDYINVDQLTREMVVEFIDKIVVDCHYNINVYFKFSANR
ncbi:MAG: recombinase family protein [Candidatus Galacturonibacter soehngenii]|nr:recombinase family protein [Candidatus Galacturonibacter soehngenii]